MRREPKLSTLGSWITGQQSVTANNHGKKFHYYVHYFFRRIANCTVGPMCMMKVVVQSVT